MQGILNVGYWPLKDYNEFWETTKQRLIIDWASQMRHQGTDEVCIERLFRSWVNVSMFEYWNQGIYLAKCDNQQIRPYHNVFFLRNLQVVRYSSLEWKFSADPREYKRSTTTPSVIIRSRIEKSVLPWSMWR